MSSPDFEFSSPPVASALPPLAPPPSTPRSLLRHRWIRHAVADPVLALALPEDPRSCYFTFARTAPPLPPRRRPPPSTSRRVGEHTRTAASSSLFWCSRRTPPRSTAPATFGPDAGTALADVAPPRVCHLSAGSYVDPTWRQVSAKPLSQNPVDLVHEDRVHDTWAHTSEKSFYKFIP